MKKRLELNLRDLGGIPCAGGEVPRGLFLRSGELSILTPEECAALCREYHIRCVIDLRTHIEAAEFPDPLPEGVTYLSVPMIKESTVGITHEQGSDPIAIIRGQRKHPERLKAMIPDFTALYHDVVTDDYSKSQIASVVAKLRENADQGVCTLFHCTAGKDRTGIVSMALLKTYGVSDEAIIKDYLLTNRNAFLPTLKKCIGIGLMTRNWSLVKTAYHAFMADRKLIEEAIKCYDAT